MTDICRVPSFHGEFWTSSQKEGNSLHSFTYRGCYKAQLPRFFISRLTDINDIVCDPFMGRGTTLIEASLMGRMVNGSDINPISPMIVAPRLEPPSLEKVVEKLDEMQWGVSQKKLARWKRRNPHQWDEMEPYFHKDTFSDILMLRERFLGLPPWSSSVEAWIRMVTMAILTGHSPGFLSRYTLPPGSTAYPDAQRRINAKHRKGSEPKDVKKLIIAKSARLLATGIMPASRFPALDASSADNLSLCESQTVKLVMTSPPFVDTIDYAKENWLRMWFAGIIDSYADLQSEKTPSIWRSGSISGWEQMMVGAMREMSRVLVPGGVAAIEVGEIRNGTETLDDRIIRLSQTVGLIPFALFVHEQNFTKTSHIWGVKNKTKGTNTNRIVLLRKPGGVALKGEDVLASVGSN